jgi:hypothetical protein
VKSLFAAIDNSYKLATKSKKNLTVPLPEGDGAEGIDS